MVLALWSLVASAQAQDCKDVDPFLGSAESYVEQFELDDAKADLANALQAFGCGAPVAPTQLTRFFLVQGVAELFGEDPSRAVPSFAAARDGDPSYWLESYGEEARAAFADAVRPEGSAPLSVTNLVSGETVWVDGVKVKPESSLSVGFHILQVGPKNARFAKLLEVSPDVPEEVRLPTLAVDLSNVVGVSEGGAIQVVQKKNRRKGRILAGIITGSVAAAMYGGAVGTRVGMYDKNPSEAGYFLTNGLYWGSIGVATLGGGLTIAGLATPSVN